MKINTIKINTIKINTIIQSIRLPFLILTPVCVLLGASMVIFEQKNIDLLSLIIVLIGALLAHISVNTLNEYLDFKSGLDLHTKQTNFSGGSGALVKNPQMLNSVLMTGILSLVGTLIVGIYFVNLYGSGIVLIGILGTIIIVSYTSWINKHPLICLIAPGFSFGFLMVLGTQFILMREYTASCVLISLIPFFLVNNLLLLNQYPDIAADTQAGRRHFPIVYGIGLSNQVYGISIFLTTILIFIYIILGYLPMLSLVALIPIPLGFFSLYGAIKHGKSIGNFPKYLGANVIVTILTPLLLALSILF